MKEEQPDLITNVDDRAICDLVIEQKGSLGLLNKSINEICLMIISDPLTIKLIDGLKKKYLSENIKNLTINEFNYEETEFENLLNLIIKLHVFENIKNNIETNLNETKTNNDSKVLEKNNIQNINSSFSNNNNFTNNNSSQNKFESIPKNKPNFGHDNNNNGFYFQNSKDSESFGMRKSFNICELNNNKENNNFLNDLKSNKYLELNLQNFNQYDDLKDINNVKNFKNKFKKENLNTETIKDSSSDYKKKQSNNLNNEAVFTFNENFNKKENDKYDDFTTNTNKEIYYLNNKNENEYKDYNLDNKKSFVENYYNQDESFHVIEYDQIIEKFLESEELKCLIESEIPINNENENENEKKGKPTIEIENKINNSNNQKKLGTGKLFNKKNKRILLEKLTNFQIAENNNITIINKIINSKKKEYYINNNCYNINSENKSSVLFESLFNDYKSNKNFQTKSKNENFNKNNHNINAAENINISGNNDKIFNQNSNKNQENFIKNCNNFISCNEDKQTKVYKQCNGNNENLKMNNNKINNCNNNYINQKNKEMEYNKNFNFIKDNSNISNINNNSNNKYSSFNSNSDYKKSIFKITKNSENNLNKNEQINLSFSINDGNKEAHFFKKAEDKIINHKGFVNNDNKTNSIKSLSNNNNEDVRIKYTSIEEENLINTNCCFISNNLLDRLMNLKDPNLFLNIIEKIIVNNIVYSILGKDKYTSSTKLKYNSNLNQSIVKDNKENELYNAISKNEKELNNNLIIKSNNTSKEKQYNMSNKDILKSAKAIDKQNIFNNNIKIREEYNLENQKRNSEIDFEDETFYNIYNKIKDSHNINKIKFEDSNENNNNSLNLSLEERDKINIEKFFSNSNNKKKNGDFENGNNLHLSLAENFLNNGNLLSVLSEKNINKDYIKSFISSKIEYAKKEEKSSRSNINCNNKNNISKYNNNMIDNNQQMTAFGNSCSKHDLGINNFNFYFHPKLNLLQRKKNHE